MSHNTIIASMLVAAQRIIANERDAADPITASSTDYRGRAIDLLMNKLSTKDAASSYDLQAFLEKHKAYDEGSIMAAFGALPVLAMEENVLIDALDENADIAVHGAGQPDDEIMGYILGSFCPAINQASATTTAPTAAPVSSAPTKVSDQVRTGINSLLAMGTANAYTDIDNVLLDLHTTKESEAKFKAEVQRLAQKASAIPMPTGGTSASPIGDLTYDVVERPAYELFTDSRGRRVPKGKGLDMMVPTLVWKDSTGQVVAHPLTPDTDDEYCFDMMQVIQYLTALLRGMNTWLFGHTGTGKSTFVEQVAARLGWPVNRVNLDSNLERADLVGHIVLAETNGATISNFEEGILPRALQTPGILLMDEIDAGRPDILFVIQRALEGKGLMLTEDKGRIVKPHPLFRFAATANTRGQGDEYGMYAGTRNMNASMLDRFTAFLEFKYMPVKEEVILLMKRCPALPQAMADMIGQFAAEIRKAFTGGEVMNTISPRGLTVFADTYVTLTGYGMPEDAALRTAMDLSILNKVPNDTRQKFTELAARVFSVKSSTVGKRVP